MTILINFFVLSIINVVFSTIRSLTTIKSGKGVASLVSGGYFAFYNIMLVATVANFPMWQKCVITFVCNVIGVWVVKLVEEKLRKDRMWKFEVTFPISNENKVIEFLKANNIPHDYNTVGERHTKFNIYCATQAESEIATKAIKNYNGKYFITETCMQTLV